MLKKSFALLTLALALAFTALVTPPATAAPLFTYVVDSDGDQPDDSIGNNICHTAVNTCTLRAALQEAGSSIERDNIIFNIAPGGLKTIEPATLLPTIEYPVTLDASTQPNCPAYPCIELNGDLAPTGDGLILNGADIVIRGLNIGGFGGSGILANGTGGVIQGNYIGTDITGSALHTNAGYGIEVNDRNVTIGGSTPAQRNLISGNAIAGIHLTDQDAFILGNYIGTNATGNQALPNQVGIAGAGGSTANIGGGSPGEGNLISGNASAGISLNNTGFFTLRGNYIGTDASGTTALPNIGDGIALLDSNASIGGNLASQGNVISGNEDAGINIQGLSQAFIFNNFIGADLTGTAAIPNGDGIITNASNPVFIILNVISGNSDFAVALQGDNARLVANKIGVGANGASLPNGGGVRVQGSNNQIGTLQPTGLPNNGNVIANNLSGVYVLSGSGNLITGNSISQALFTNLRVDPGANNDQPAPVLADATQDSGIVVQDASVRVRGTLNATANADYRLEFFASPSCTEAGNEEGKTFLGAITTAFPASGVQPFDLTVSATATPGAYITLTATDADDNTSQFSNCIPLQTPETSCSTPPAAPTSLLPPNGSNVSVTQVPLDWSDVQCTTGYNVVLRQDSKTGPKIIKKAKPTVSHLTTPALDPAHNYVWRVRSCNNTGCGPWTEWQTFRVKRNATLQAENGSAWWSMQE